MKNKKTVWEQIDSTELNRIYDYATEYKQFLDRAKTEREATAFIIDAAKTKGFKSLECAVADGVKPGDKIYLNNHNKSVVLFVVGKDIESGMNIVGSHIDSPRLDVKQQPLYEAGNMAYLKTHYYGGVNKYQWPTIPLAIHGLVITKEGEHINLVIGEKDDDPVFFINDLLPHLGGKQRAKKLDEAIEGEKLNVLVGHSSFGAADDEGKVKSLVLNYLKTNYGMEEEDFAVAELEIVPATHARDVGFDRALIAAHGHDDRVCSYANLKAIFDVDAPEKTTVALFADKEEIGSVGNTGMSANFFENAVAELIAATGEYNDLKLRRAMANSKVLSADVTAAIDPDYADVMDDKNAAVMGGGVTISKYTGSRGKSGSNDANAEFLHELRTVLNDAEVIWQTGELGKVDAGGGGTIAYILAQTGAQVVDMGTGMLSMHAPVELVSIADAYMTYKGYSAFMQHMK
ncbi:aminopeptidase [Peptoniphilus equinus]|uniref:M18 family aminopeptidase n=1 Tax=Peptoniphilus equinus TaxID=3016343 RepID=A0ABY7QTK3_9FIRM|nr:aminopeptidase [Peptoniphilus equinus]WBW50121.1 aminopeptidase [Peptoniphilus equinus]